MVPSLRPSLHFTFICNPFFSPLRGVRTCRSSLAAHLLLGAPAGVQPRCRALRPLAQFEMASLSFSSLGRYPTIKHAILDLGSDAGQVVGALRALQKALLPSELHASRLADVLENLESQLASRGPTLNPVLAGANPTVGGVLAAILKENSVMAQAGQSAANNIVGGGAPSGGADADGLALTRQSFKDVESALGQLDLTTETGQRSAIGEILGRGRCILAMRILLHPNPKGSDPAATRHPSCVAINSLRLQLHNYFNYVLRLDHTGAAPVLPAHMMKYEFATATSAADPNSFLSRLLRFEFDAMNFFEAPHGAGAWARHVNASAASESVARVNYFVQLSNVRRVKNFVLVLLTSLGLPRAAAYSWTEFVDLYVEKLQLADTLPLLLDQYHHLAACAKIFEAALVAMRYRLTALVRDPDPSSRSMSVPMFAIDSSPILALQASWVAKSLASGRPGEICTEHVQAARGKAASANWETLKLDDAYFVDHLKNQAKKAKVGDSSYSLPSLPFGMDSLTLSGGSGSGASLPPGSLSQSYRWLKGRLIISGNSWDVSGAAKHLGVPAHGPGAPCWPFLLSACEDKNRMARCPHSGKADHADHHAAAHVLAATLDRVALASQFSTKATPEQTHGLIKTPEGRGKGRGRGRGKGEGRGQGGRGRGHQGDGRAEALPEAKASEQPAESAQLSHGEIFAELESLKRRLAGLDCPEPKLSSPPLRSILAPKPKAHFADSQPGSSGAPLLLEYQGAPPGGFQSGEDGLPGASQPCSSFTPSHFRRPPQIEPSGGGHSPRFEGSVLRHFHLGVGDVSTDLALDSTLARLLRELPTARRNALYATCMRELPSPLKTLANAMSDSGRFVVDCGGQGQCGPNTIGYLLGLVGLAVLDGVQVRQAVIEHVRGPANRARRTRFRDPVGRLYTLEGLILRCMHDAPGGAPGPLTHTVDGWCHHIAQPASWTDLAFLQVAADCFQVALLIHTVNDLSTVGSLGAILPCHHGAPVALLEVGMWMGRHLVAIVTADGTSGGADRTSGDTLRPSAPRGSLLAVERDERPPAHAQLLPAGGGTAGPISSHSAPLTIEQVSALIHSAAPPTVLVACEFSGALISTLAAQGHSAISCDLRPAEHGFPHYQGDVRDIVHLRRWERAYFFPNCFQHLRGDEHCLRHKIHDCRAFWAAAMVLWCLACPHADVVVVEQPDTIVYDYADVSAFAALHEFCTSQYGDPAQHNKFVRLAVRNATLAPPSHPVSRQPHRATHLDYLNPDARDRARSSWACHTLTCRALAGLQQRPPVEAPTYIALLAVFVSTWFRSGHPVPSDYLNEDAQPTSPAWREYQLVRGPGDGRRPLLLEQAPYEESTGEDIENAFGALKTHHRRFAAPTLPRLPENSKQGTPHTRSQDQPTSLAQTSRNSAHASPGRSIQSTLTSVILTGQPRWLAPRVPWAALRTIGQMTGLLGSRLAHGSRL